MSSDSGEGLPHSQDGNAHHRDDEGPSSFGSDRAGPTTLQGLLRRLGADISDIFPGNSGSSQARLQQLRNTIVAPENPEEQLEALTELSEFLSVGTEESVVSHSVNLFVSPLVNLLRTGANVEIKIFAARSLTHMMEALPSSSSAIAINGAAGPLCQNLLAIEYIDLAEQSLSALFKLSADYPHQIVSANGFQAVLSFIDFFPIGVQRVAAATACNLCRSPRADAVEMIASVLPIMMRLLGSDDQRIRESALVGFTRLAEAFRTSPEKLETLCSSNFALIDEVFGLIVPPSPPALSPQSHSSALRLLSLLARGSAKLGLRILSTDTLVQRLRERIDEASPVHALDCLNLADCLLPEMQEFDIALNQAPRTRRPRRSSSSSTTSSAIDLKRREELEQNIEVLEFFGRTLFVSLMKFYISSADAHARRIALSVMSKFIALSTNSVLNSVVGKEDGPSGDPPGSSISFCPFVAALLSENSSPNEAIVGLAMAASTLQKLPSLRESFLREGVVHEVLRLANSGLEIEHKVEGDQNSPHVGHGMTPGMVENSENASNANEQVLSALDTCNSDLLWSAVHSIQRGLSLRSNRSEHYSSASRPPARAFLEVRLPPVHSVHAILPRIAKSILKNYLESDPSAAHDDVLQNASLGRLSEVCNLLSSGDNVNLEGTASLGLEQLLRLLLSSERLTVFEVSRSGIMSSLSGFLSFSDQSGNVGRLSEFMMCLTGNHTGEAYTTLVNLALGVLSSEEKLPLQISESNSSPTFIGSGLRQLTQPFKLRLKKASSENGGGDLRDYAHHVVLIEPLAIMASVQEFLWPRVKESQSHTTGSTSGPSQIANNDDALERDGASVHDSETGSIGPGDRNDQTDDDFSQDRFDVEDMFDVDEDAIGDAMVNDGDEDNNSDGSDEDVSSADDDMIEHDVGEIDDHEGNEPDAMDVEQLARSVTPLELDHDALGLAPSRGLTLGSGRGSTGSRNSDPSRNELAFRSYAAALAANIQRATGFTGAGRFGGRAAITPDRNDGRRRRDLSSPKLSFSLNSQRLTHDCSILSAVIHATGDDRGISARLWSDTHTLVYSRAENSLSLNRVRSGPRVSPEISGKLVGGSTDGSAPLRRSQRLQEHRDRSSNSDVRSPPKTSATPVSPIPSLDLWKNVCLDKNIVSLPQKEDMSDLPKEISSVVDVLKHLHWMYEMVRNCPIVLKDNGTSISELNISGPIQFMSHKVSGKLLRQLSDPLALAGGVIPSWCFELARVAPFLIPFDVRRILFQSSSFSVSRVLHLLQTRNDMSGVGNSANRQSRSHRDEARVSRLHRQKVRVHRHRILESAIKVMNLYSTHNTVLEVQYFDEAGTGLGPTLEFYTMTSRELQRIDLRLWRGTNDDLSKSKEIGGSISAAFRINNALMSSSRSGKRRSRRNLISNANITAAPSHCESDDLAFIIPTGSGLFPSCLPLDSSENGKELAETTKALFGFVGRLLGKSFVDGRFLDLRFSEVFSRLLLAYCHVILEKRKRGESKVDASVGGSNPRFSVDDELDKIDRDAVWSLFISGTSTMRLLESVDTQLASSLQSIIGMLERGEKDAIASLCLTFVLPDDNKIELVQDGTNIDVTAENGEEFVRRVMFHVLFGGVYQQAESLLRGLGEVIDVTKLLLFRGNELELLACGPSFEEWTVPFLVEATRCDHGYSHESTAVTFLLQILSELNESDQQRFVLFTTGSPALPLGGLRNLHPKLTIVRRTPEGGRSPDECLPTVMTCTNYFKLPDYSSYEVARKQIMYAVREGQRSFHLS